MAVYCTSAVLSVCTVLRLTTFFQRTWGCQDSSQIDKSRTGRAWWSGFEEREIAAACWAALSVYTVWGPSPAGGSPREDMVHHEPAWPAVHGLLRPQGPLQDPPQTPPAPAAAGDCTHKVGHTIMHPLHVISYFSLACSTFQIFLTAENCCAWVSFFFIEDSLLHPNTQESWDGQVLFGV